MNEPTPVRSGKYRRLLRHIGMSVDVMYDKFVCVAPPVSDSCLATDAVVAALQREGGFPPTPRREPSDPVQRMHMKPMEFEQHSVRLPQRLIQVDWLQSPEGVTRILPLNPIVPNSTGAPLLGHSESIRVPFPPCTVGSAHHCLRSTASGSRISAGKPKRPHSTARSNAIRVSSR